MHLYTLEHRCILQYISKETSIVPQMVFHLCKVSVFPLKRKEIICHDEVSF